MQIDSQKYIDKTPIKCSESQFRQNLIAKFGIKEYIICTKKNAEVMSTEGIWAHFAHHNVIIYDEPLLLLRIFKLLSRLQL